jgi:hypothetical protein
MNMMKNGKKSAAAVDLTTHKMARPTHWQTVNRCIFKVRT